MFISGDRQWYGFGNQNISELKTFSEY